MRLFHGARTVFEVVGVLLTFDVAARRKRGSRRGKDRRRDAFIVVDIAPELPQFMVHLRIHEVVFGVRRDRNAQHVGMRTGELQSRVLLVAIHSRYLRLEETRTIGHAVMPSWAVRESPRWRHRRLSPLARWRSP